MTTIETTGSLDQATVDALREGVAGVLAEQSNSLAMHAFIDGKNSLDRDLWSSAASLGGLVSAFPSNTAGSAWAATGLPSCTANSVGRPRLGRSSPRSRPLRQSSKMAPKRSAQRGCRLLRPVRSTSPSRPSPVRHPRHGPARGVSGALRCLGGRDATFVLAAPAGDAWVIVELAGA